MATSLSFQDAFQRKQDPESQTDPQPPDSYCINYKFATVGGHERIAMYSLSKILSNKYLAAAKISKNGGAYLTRTHDADLETKEWVISRAVRATHMQEDGSEKVSWEPFLSCLEHDRKTLGLEVLQASDYEISGQDAEYEPHDLVLDSHRR
eukprot:jgi/Mesen1/458/ME000101S10694